MRGAVVGLTVLLPGGSGHAGLSTMFDLEGPDGATMAAVLLHPHPDMGGNRFHPLVSHLHRRLPEAGVGSVRFDFSSADSAVARGEVAGAVEAATEHWPGASVALVGYSFGAAMAAGVGDERVAAWMLVAPIATALSASRLGDDPRPKLLVVPEHDNFSPPSAVEAAIVGWQATELRLVPGDHFLGESLAQIVDDAVDWFGRLVV